MSTLTATNVVLETLPLDPDVPMVVVKTQHRTVIGWDPSQITRDQLVLLAAAAGVDVR